MRAVDHKVQDRVGYAIVVYACELHLPAFTAFFLLVFLVAFFGAFFLAVFLVAFFGAFFLAVFLVAFFVAGFFLAGLLAVSSPPAAAFATQVVVGFSKNIS